MQAQGELFEIIHVQPALGGQVTAACPRGLHSWSGLGIVTLGSPREPEPTLTHVWEPPGKERLKWKEPSSGEVTPHGPGFG